MPRKSWGTIRGALHPHLQVPTSVEDRLNLDVPVLDGAACVGEDSEVFFSDFPAAVAAAKAVCNRCPARTACLERALTNREAFGVFGGLTAGERRSLLRKRRKEAAA